jgi:hypothetical protein
MEVNKQNRGLFGLAMSSKEPVLTDSKTLNEVVNCLTEQRLTLLLISHKWCEDK